MKQVVASLFEKGVREVVCVHAPEGGWYSRRGEGIYFQPSLNMTNDMIKGKLGVGDAFCAGMLYSLYREFDPEYSLRVAGAAAGCNLTAENSIDGLRIFDKMMEFESEIGYMAD
jgi:sugar/nucleoside kinase (ribokinase family)